MSGEPRTGTTVIVGPGQYFASALIEQFSASSADLLLMARDEVRLQELASAARGYGTVRVVVADVTAEDMATRLLKGLEGLQPVKTVIYNVKVSPKGTPHALDTSDFTSAITANVSGSLALMKVMARSDFPRLPDAVFINTGGGFKDAPDTSRLALSVSKAGVHNLTLGMRLAMEHIGVHVKTLVVDGVVRDEGPITPDVVAAKMADLARSRHIVYRVDSNDSAQLSLFDDTDELHAV